MSFEIGGLRTTNERLLIMNKKKIDYRFKILYAVAILMVVAGHCDGGGISLNFRNGFRMRESIWRCLLFVQDIFLKMQH